MKRQESSVISKIKWFLVFSVLIACVDKIDFNIPSSQFQMVVEGMISDGDGPYTVKLSRSLNLNIDSIVLDPITQATIMLYEDNSASEQFIEVSKGIYSTTGIIKGKIGHSYNITILTADGKKYESEPELLNESGNAETISYEFEARKTKIIGNDELDANVFKIFVDATATNAPNNYVRWRYTGTYKIINQPELHTTLYPPDPPIKSPLPCSGYIVTPALGGGKLEKVAECTCCICWVNNYEVMPTVSNGELIVNNLYKHVKVGEVSINGATFLEKYLVTVEQMSLSKNAYDFFNLVRIQKESASSLFQPSSGEIRGNIKAVNGSDVVIGIFWASSIKTKRIYIDKSEVPYNLVPQSGSPYACNDLPNSTNIKPAFWE